MNLIRNTLLIFIILAMAAVTSITSNVMADDHEEEGHVCFYAVDADGNASLSMEEIKKAYPESDETFFGKLDLDQNGSISHEEYEDAIEKAMDS